MKVFTPSGYEWKGTRLARFIERHGYGSLDQLQEDAERDAPVFWDRVVAEVGLEWSTPYTQTLDMSDGIMWPRWFVGGRLDLVDNIVGKHARRHPDKVAVRWEGDAGEERRITYAELAREVDGMAAGLRALGAGEGSRIAWSLALYVLALACWLPVVWIQLRLREISAQAAASNSRLPPAYWRFFGWWVALGAVAFVAFLAIFWLMVAKRVPFAG